EDIRGVIYALTSTNSPDVQMDTINKYYLPNAAFKHPTCSVSSGPSSRDRILSIYQWYRVISPKLESEVKSVIFDSKLNIMDVEIVQQFHIFLSPFSAAPARLLVRLTLSQDAASGLYYIAQQEDFYHTEDFIALILPPLVPLIQLCLYVAALFSIIGAKIAQVFGIWLPKETLVAHGVGDAPLYESEPEGLKKK
ncbi:hypothetical protein FISHEDRAFT_50837, partial [Fistulina hepatica ATCC 64428]